MINLTRLQIRFDLPPSLAKILVLLTQNEVVTSRMIELDHKLTKDAKVAIHRLRRRLDSTVEIQSKRDVGYWLDPEAKKTVIAVQADEAQSGDSPAAVQ